MVYGSSLTKRAATFACVLMLAVLAVLPVDAWASEIIVHPSVQRSTISVRELRAIYGLRLNRWRSGEPIKVFVYSAGNAEHASFCKNILKIFPHQLQAAWDRATFSGTGQAPVKVRSMEEMFQVVSQTPGAIGYVGRIESRNDGTVKTIKVE